MKEPRASVDQEKGAEAPFSVKLHCKPNYGALRFALSLASSLASP
jgi:hypothetical protein